MAVDDLWYLKKKGPDGRRLPSRRHGRGKRYRVRWVDPETGAERAELYDRKADADRIDANRKADISRGQYIDPAAGRITVAQYAEQWRRQQLHGESTTERVEGSIRLHIAPVLGDLQMSAVRPSHLRGWVKARQDELKASTLNLIYSGILVPLFRAAVLDRVIGTTPCVGVRLPEVEDLEHYIPKPEQVHALYEALPEQLRAVVYLAAGCGLRGGEIFGLELASVDFLRREVHVRQQLKGVGGRRPFLGAPKTRTSRRTVELPPSVADALALHLERNPVKEQDIDDDTGRTSVRRPAQLLFTNSIGAPMYRSVWSDTWRRAVRKVGVPEPFGLHGLRHYYATALIFGGANVKTVQLALGHSQPTITLDTYLGYWPDAVDRTRSLIEGALFCTGSGPVTVSESSGAGQAIDGG